MNNDVIPTFETAAAKIEVVLSDNGREFLRQARPHPYELFLQLEEIEHRTTRSSGRNPTASSSVSTARFSTSTSASKAARPGSIPSRRCRLCSRLLLLLRFCRFCESVAEGAGRCAALHAASLVRLALIVSDEVVVK